MIDIIARFHGYINNILQLKYDKEIVFKNWVEGAINFLFCFLPKNTPIIDSLYLSSIKNYLLSNQKNILKGYIN